MNRALRTLVPLAAAAALPLALSPAVAHAASSDSSYQTTLNPLNGSSGSGMATISLSGDQAQVNVSWSGLPADFDGGAYPHVQHIHIDGQGQCPSPSADQNGDGVVSVTEGAPSYGGIGTTLSTKGDTSPNAGTDITIAPSGGSTDYSRSIALDSSTVASLENGTAVVVVHGLDPSTLREGAEREERHRAEPAARGDLPRAVRRAVGDARRRRGHRHRQHERRRGHGSARSRRRRARPGGRRGDLRRPSSSGRRGLSPPEERSMMSAHARRRQHQGVLWTIALAAMVTGAVLLTLALRAQVGAPVAQSAGRIDPPGPAASAPPSASGSPGTARTEPSDGPTPARRQGPAPLGASPPRTISIAIGLTSKVNPIGLAEDGSIAVPQPGPLLDQAAWFQNSPTPGQPGPSVIEGHVDTESGPSVFFELGTVEPGQQVLVTRKDGSDD